MLPSADPPRPLMCGHLRIASHTISILHRRKKKEGWINPGTSRRIRTGTKRALAVIKGKKQGHKQMLGQAAPVLVRLSAGLALQLITGLTPAASRTQLRSLARSARASLGTNFTRQGRAYQRRPVVEEPARPVNGQVGRMSTIRQHTILDGDLVWRGQPSQGQTYIFRNIFTAGNLISRRLSTRPSTNRRSTRGGRQIGRTVHGRGDGGQLGRVGRGHALPASDSMRLAERAEEGRM